MLGRLDEAEELFRKIMDYYENDEVSATGDAGRGLARVLVEQGRFDEAEPIYVWILDSYKKRLSSGHRWTASVKREWGRCLTGLGRYDEAEEVLLRSHEWLEHHLGRHDRGAQLVMTRLAELYEAWGKPDKAAEWRAKLGELEAEQSSDSG